MMVEYVSWEDSLQLDNVKYIDVRSPLEFEEDHVPNAINIPIFSNEERHQVGLMYKEQANKIASELGLSIVAPKLPTMMKQLDELSKDFNVVIYCFRGGMRSRSIGTVAHLMGIKSKVLTGGYKKYRSYINEYFDNNVQDFEIILLKGLTGVGKTDLLKELVEIDVGVIDLEGLANNRGSVYGSIGLPPQPSQKYFESYLWYQMYNQHDKKYLLLECEGKRVGKLRVPASLFQAMGNAVGFLVYDSMQNRVDRIVAEYGDNTDKTQLIAATMRLKKLLGKDNILKCIEYIYDDNYNKVVERILLPYYDKYYDYPCCASEEYVLSIDNADPSAAAKIVKEYLDTMISR